MGGDFGCPKHGGAGWVTCCTHVAEAARDGLPCPEAKWRPRTPPFTWCVCAPCYTAALALQAAGVPKGTLPAQARNPVCGRCFEEWWAAHGYPARQP
jgi:hypothetical protein